MSHQNQSPTRTSGSTLPEPTTVLEGLGKDPRLIPQESTNFESPLALADGLLTPNERFFIRSNGPVSVDIDPESWRLGVTGLVERELALSLADLKTFPHQTITAFLECSGNSRNRFPTTPAQVQGTNWGNGAVGNAEWTGVPLSTVLEQAGIRDGAVEVVSQGGDFGGMQRGLPIETALTPEVMLVWQMNGQDLPAPHGGPVRLLVPGWGAIASTKWLLGLEVIDHPFDAYYQTEQYVLYDETGAATGPVTLMPVKSLISSPAPDSVVRAGHQTITGYAWSGYGGIAKVDVSTDGGDSWVEARIAEEAGPLSWVRFEHPWEAVPGPAKLRSRATDAEGNVQPEQALWNAKGYQMNAIYEVLVTVR
jgi:DMSO/TMAO reductase YedYZ molybdopterin-dependent catalytic subunit